MLIRIKDRLINADQIVEARISSERESGRDEDGDVIRARPLSVEITTTATTSEYDDGGDYPHTARVETFPYTIRLYGEQAELFLAALPVYTPVLEGGE